METSGPTSGIPPSISTATRSPALQWQVGQLLQATVTESNAGKVLLSIGNRPVTTETSLPLEKGQQLTVQVRSLGELPVLKIASPLREAPIAEAIRLLLPRQGQMTPLLANLGLLARTPNPPVPPLITEAVRALVRQLPSPQAVSTPEGLKKAFIESGIFLENQLRKPPGPASTALAATSDFKANLLRLVQLVRNWPGSSGQSTAQTAAPSSRPTAPGIPAAPLSAAPAPHAAAPVTTGINIHPGTTHTGLPPSTPSAPAGTEQTTANRPPEASATPEQVRRAVQATATGRPQAPTQPAAQSSITTTAAAIDSSRAASQVPAAAAAINSPPLRGSVPVAQSAVQASVDLLNRLGNVRADLLLQGEAALTRLQLNQLAALPREGERGLLEWLFELPIRRGDDIDLWSLRLFRDPRQRQQDNEGHTPSWSVQLAFDLPGLGPVQARVQLSGEQVSTHFWTQREQTLPLLNSHLHELRQAMTAAGLDVGELKCRTGCMPAEKPGDNQPLISEKA
jgi:hypothetical protein